MSKNQVRKSKSSSVQGEHVLTICREFKMQQSKPMKNPCQKDGKSRKKVEVPAKPALTPYCRYIKIKTGNTQSESDKDFRTRGNLHKLIEVQELLQSSALTAYSVSGSESQEEIGEQKNGQNAATRKGIFKIWLCSCQCKEIRSTLLLKWSRNPVKAFCSHTLTHNRPKFNNHSTALPPSCCLRKLV